MIKGFVKASEQIPPRLLNSDYSDYVHVKISNGEDDWLRKEADRYDYAGQYWEEWHSEPFAVVEWLDESEEQPGEKDAVAFLNWAMDNSYGCKLNAEGGYLWYECDDPSATFTPEQLYNNFQNRPQ